MLRAFELRLLKTQGYLGDAEKHLTPMARHHFSDLLSLPFVELPPLNRATQKELARPFWEQRRNLGLKPTKSAQFLKQFQEN